MMLPLGRVTSMVVIATAIALGGARADAQTLPTSRCAGAKVRCIMGKTHVCGVAGVRGQLKCNQRASSKSSPVDPECLQLAVDKLRDCFAAAEQRNDCLTIGDANDVQNHIDDYVQNIVDTLNPDNPAPITNLCFVGKMKALADGTADKLACFEDAFRAGAAADPTCLALVDAHLANTWTKLESGGDCLTMGGLDDFEAGMNAFIAATIAGLDP